MGVTLRSERINKVLANANELAKTDGYRLTHEQELHSFRLVFEQLQNPAAPKTYTAVMAVLLAARALHEADELDVLAIQAGTSNRGYSASSIGTRVASFAKEQGIDLRAKSSQPMNNQPFTFEPWITEDMKVQARAENHFKLFYSAAKAINVMSSARAKEALALLFHMSRRADVAAIAVRVRSSGKATLETVASAVSDFTDTYSDNGKVGQAFVAAVLDLVYARENVTLGDTQDPDVSTPGDVQVGELGELWLWCEAKQKVISTGDITGFLKKVDENADGERVEYFALKNAGYSGNISPEAVAKEAAKREMTVGLYQSPREALDHFLPLAPGAHGAVAGRLLERYRARLTEAGCPDATIEAFDEMATRYAELEVKTP